MLKSIALIISLSGASGFSSPAPGVEASIIGSNWTVEASAYDVEKTDGGDGFATSFRVSHSLGHRGSFGLGGSCIRVDQYNRCDPFVYLGYGALLGTVTESWQRLELRPQWTLGDSVWVSPRLSYTQGRGSEGFSGAIGVGVQW